MKQTHYILIHPDSTQIVKEMIERGDREVRDFTPMFNGLYAMGYCSVAMQCFIIPYTDVANFLKCAGISFTFTSYEDALLLSSLLIDYYKKKESAHP